MTTTERAYKYMRTNMSDWPPSLLEYARFVNSQIGWCGDVAHGTIERWASVVPEGEENSVNVDAVIFTAGLLGLTRYCYETDS